jgi:hypothetical protein
VRLLRLCAFFPFFFFCHLDPKDDPRDDIYENIDLPAMNVVGRRVFVFIFAAAITACCCGGIYGLLVGFYFFVLFCFSLIFSN